MAQEDDPRIAMRLMDEAAYADRITLADQPPLVPGHWYHMMFMSTDTGWEGVDPDIHDHDFIVNRHMLYHGESTDGFHFSDRQGTGFWEQIADHNDELAYWLLRSCMSDISTTPDDEDVAASGRVAIRTNVVASTRDNFILHEDISMNIRVRRMCRNAVNGYRQRQRNAAAEPLSRAAPQLPLHVIDRIVASAFTITDQVTPMWWCACERRLRCEQL